MAERLLAESVKKTLLVCALSLALFGQAVAQADHKLTNEAWVRLSRVQSMIEYFFMEAGFYPSSLEELEQLLNSKAPRGVKQLAVPKDPATNHSFTYSLDKAGKKYILTVPDATKYEMKPLVTSLDWGFLADLAELRRFEQVVRHTTNIMKAVATQCELYAKDHQGQFPNALDDLMPKYMARFPTDPLTGKNFAYKRLPAGYVVGCPNPERYGFKIFQYSSVSGMQLEQVNPKDPKGTATPAPAPKPAVAPVVEPTPAPKEAPKDPVGPEAPK